MDESSFASATVGAAASPEADAADSPDRLHTHAQPHGQQQGNCDAISPAQRFFTNGLHIIFSFLCRDSFGVAFRCCRHWSAAGATMPPRNIEQRIRDQDDLEQLVNSTLARHVSALRFLSASGLPPWLLSLHHHLPQLHRHLPHLTEIHFDVRRGRSEHDEEYGSDETPTAMWTQMLKQLPSTVRKMSLDLLCLDWPVVDWVMETLCESGLPLTSLRLGCHLGERGYIWLPPGQMPVSTLRRLLRLKDSLVEFEFYHSPYWTDRGPPKFRDEFGESANTLHGKSARWTQEHIDVFRQLVLLEKLIPFNGRWSDEEIIMLAAEPTPAHLHIMPLDMPPITPEGIDAFVRLPLTQVFFDAFGAGSSPIQDLSFLGRMTTLEDIRLDLTSTSGSVAVHYHARTDALVDALASCTRLTRLDLTAMPLTNSHLCRLLPALTSLRRLAVCTPRFSFLGRQSGTHGIGGLSFASTVPHLARTLEELILYDRRTASMPLDELRHLHALTNLQTMSLHLRVPSSTPKDVIARVNGELDSNEPTFRRDLWLHLQYTSRCSVAAADSDDGQ